MTPGAALGAWQVAVLVLAVLVASAAAGAFNQYVERDLDARMARTRGRAFVTGAPQARRRLAVADRRSSRGARRRRRPWP